MYRARKVLVGVLALILSLLVSQRAIAVRYWDTNGATGGSGNAGGSWAGSNWSTDPTGAISTITWASNDDAVFSAGTDGTGSFTIDVGAAQNIRNLTVQEGNITLGTSGSLNTSTSGANPVWTVASGSSLTIQRDITDTAGHLIDFQGGGNSTVSSKITMTGWLGASTSGVGALELSGTGSSVGRLIVGYGGSGNLKISGGDITVTQGTAGFTSQAANGTTTYAQTNGNVNFSSSSAQFFGNNTLGTRTNNFTADISGGTFSMLGASSYFMLNCFGTAKLNVSGTADVSFNKLGLSWDSHAGNNAEINLNGGTLSVGSVGETISSAIQSTASVSTINFNGGTLKALANNSAWLSTIDTVNIKSGGAIVNTNSFNITIANTFSNAGGGNDLTKLGNGTLTISSATAFSAIGAMDVTVTQGTLNLSALTTISLSSLKGDGVLDVTGNTATLTAGGVLMPGNNSTGVLDVSGNLDIAAIVDTGGLTFELGDSLISANNDRVDITGLLTLGTLNFADFTFVPETGFGPGVYTLFDAASLSGLIGTASGPIGNFTGTLSLDQGAGDVMLTVMAVPEPSSFAIMLLSSGVLLWFLRNKRNS